MTNISAYAFFGLDYGAYGNISMACGILTIQVGDDEFVNAAYYYNEDVLYGSELIRITPKAFVP